MTSQFFSSMSRFETDVISDLNKNIGRQAPSSEIYYKIFDIVNDATAKGKLSRHLISYIRLALKLSPYSPEIARLLKQHDQALKAVTEPKMQGLLAIMRACRDKGLPLPLIVSCEKYLPKALILQKELRGRFFSVPPVIVRGDTSLAEERYEAPVLSLPVADSYEALPVKVFETCTFLHALDEHCGVLKVDDDLTITAAPAPDLRQVASIFAAADYMGVPVHNIFHDRIWHFGKCTQPAPSVYGKPMKTVWGRGALYYLSSYAMGKLSQHYMRFPGCLDGELYEDKAVGDVLYDNNIILAQYILERLLGIDSKSPERV